MKLKYNRETLFDKNRLLPLISAAWIAFTLLFIVYAGSAWFTNTHKTFTQLDTINQLVSKNIQQQTDHLVLHIKQLNKKLLSLNKLQII
ncbi:MAG: hypothetical protein ACJAXN_002843 [Psychromonas sp.]